VEEEQSWCVLKNDKIKIWPVPDESLLFKAPELQAPYTALCQVTYQWVQIFHGEAQQFRSEQVEIRAWKVAWPIPYPRMFSWL
jgi:hypothetical protein